MRPDAGQDNSKLRDNQQTMSIRILPALLALGCLSPAAFAETYRCDVGGTTYITDKPCAPAANGPGRIGAIGPARTLSSYQQTPAVPQAPEHHRFLSQRCAELSDAIRTAPARGVGYATVNDLHREYSRNCAEDDQFARQQLSEQQAKVRDDVRAARKEAERSRQDAQHQQERCVALRDALRNRRADSEADRTSKRVAEDAYNANCLGR